MTEESEFGAVLARLLDHRGITARELADRAEVEGAEVRAVLAGAVPGDELVRRLASALGHPALDLSVLAGMAVPDDLAPSDQEAARPLRDLVLSLAALPGERRRAVLAEVHALPRERRRGGFAPRWLLPPGGGPGARLVRLLQYRNLDRLGVAMTLALVTPSYLSAPTYSVIGAGGKELTPDLLADFAAVSGFDARELAVLLGLPLPEAPRPPSPAAVDVAELLRGAGGLSAAQVERLAADVRAQRSGMTSPDS
ncbi:hypothetical protein ACIRBX_25590 [Kitasatospora sp. NPDC096147]|uniref:hypothetical protein n=1 Tax=Kitasatospora sp. NPDC096147 TaxID=3364093 RepID=UPI00382D2652